jgi:hypothetical protein
LTSPLGDDLGDLVGDILGEAARVFWGEDDVDGAPDDVVLNDVAILQGEGVFDAEVEQKVDVGDGNLAELISLEAINGHVGFCCKRRANRQ